MSKLVLWGHHVGDYQEMFDLTSQDLSGKLFEFGSGPSAFNSELTKKGGQCTSCDPLFALDKATLKTKASLIFADMIDSVTREQYKYDFGRYGGLDALIEQRRQGMQVFFDDYERGIEEHRYLPAQEITLPYKDFTFDLALSSHYLFAGLDNQDSDFHIKVIMELGRIAKEVRIFPLIDRNSQPSPFLGPVLLALQEKNFGVEVKSCDYHLQPQGNAMLRVWAQQCEID